MGDPRFPVKRGGGVVCPDCRRVAVVGGDTEALPLNMASIEWCTCGWTKREFHGISSYDRMFEIIWAEEGGLGWTIVWSKRWTGGQGVQEREARMR